MRKYVDVHTHHDIPYTDSDGSTVMQVRSLSVTKTSDTEVITEIMKDKEPPGFLFSVGWHPWDSAPTPEELEDKLVSLLPHKRIIAIGEAGLDALHGAPMEIQETLFRKQIELAERYHLPLIVHSVKTFDRIYALRRTMHPSTPWIFHGYRSKPEQMMQWLRLPGTYVSLGEHFNENTARQCPAERFLAETDESPTTIATVYQEIANVRGVTIRQLENQLLENWDTITHP